jgi:hypothetical protein
MTHGGAARQAAPRKGLNAVNIRKRRQHPTRKSRPREQDIGFDVTLLESYFFTKYFKVKSQKVQKLAETISPNHRLNAEQNRAFRIVANHAVDNTSPQLRMYLGGVGGTGKSQVIKALIGSFESRNESHRFLVIGPTQSDSWLHEMLKPRDGGPGVFNYMDAHYGVPDGESDCHYVVVAKSNRKIFVKRGPINGELLDTAKGSIIRAPKVEGARCSHP